jgi:hypothetical protein
VEEPDLAFDVWEQGMRRWPDIAPELYSNIFGLVKDDADLRDRWRQLGETDRRCLVILLRTSNPVEFQLEINRLLTDDPELATLTPTELSTLFTVWYKQGDKLRLAETLRTHPEWEKIGWRQLALALADYQDFQRACETVSHFVSPPALPEIDRSQIPFLAARFQMNHDVGNDGLRLAAAQFKSGAYDDALRTVQIALTAPRAPLALHYIAAKIHASKGDWPKAWEAIAKYEHLRD